MCSAGHVPTPKETLKERLRHLDPDFRYYKTIFHTIPDLVAITDGDKVFDANIAFVSFFAEAGIDIYDPAFSLSSVFLKIDERGYLYDGYAMMRWFDAVLWQEKRPYRVAIHEKERICDFNIALHPLEAAHDIYVVALTDISEMMGYKGALEQTVRSSAQDRDEALTLLRQYDKAINVANLVSKSNRDGTITYVNDAFCDVLGYSRDELIGDNILIFCIPDEDDMCYETVWDTIEKGNIWKGVIQNVDKQGKIHTFDTTIVPITNARGEVIEYLTIRNDITEMIAAKEEAIQTLKAKTKFFDQMSHELRTPLNAIINFADQALENYDESIEDEALQGLVRIYLERAYKNSQGLLHLINSLLDMAKLESGKETFAIGRYEAVSLVQESYENCSALHNNTDIEYRFNKNSAFAWINCDPLKFRQILTNLISNAFKFTEKGYVEVRVSASEEECQIEVEDTGAGIPETKLSAIFEPFEQARSGDVGTGLGLSIVKEYSEAMGMKLSVQSLEGKGSCFTLTAPISSHEGNVWTI